jgi:hypothetical protein
MHADVELSENRDRARETHTPAVAVPDLVDQFAAGSAFDGEHPISQPFCLELGWLPEPTAERLWRAVSPWTQRLPKVEVRIAGEEERDMESMQSQSSSIKAQDQA